MNKNKVIIVSGSDIRERAKKALEILAPILPPSGSKILIKPNLVEPLAKDSGAVTRPEVIEGIIRFLGDKNYQILIGESSGSWQTDLAFKKAGYNDLRKKYKIKLINFDQGDYIKIKTSQSIWPEIEIAKPCFDALYLISVAPLKEHPFGVTLTCKNMMGLIRPDKRYQSANKQYIHQEDNQEIWAERLCLLLKYLKPNLAIIDGTTAMYDSHINGRLKIKNLTIIGQDPVAVDLLGAEILGHQKIFYLEKMIKEKIGRRPEQIIRERI